MAGICRGDLLGVLPVLGLWTTVVLANSDMSSAYDNTLIFHVPGATLEFQLIMDGTLTGDDGAAGTRRLENNFLCLPPDTVKQSCAPLPFNGAHQAGDTWSHVGVLDMATTFQLAGR